MYARTVEDQTLTFGVSGKLWEGSLIMIDSETESLWAHLLGEAMEGPLAGQKLETIPSVISDWKTWKAGNPTTTVLNMELTTSAYKRKFQQTQGGLLIGLVEGDAAAGWDFELLANKRIRNDAVGNRSVLVTFDPVSTTAIVFDRSLADQMLEFELTDGVVTDKQTGSVWNPLTGTSIAGELEGNKLRQLPAVVSHHTAWMMFHPESAMIFGEQSTNIPQTVSDGVTVPETDTIAE